MSVVKSYFIFCALWSEWMKERDKKRISKGENLIKTHTGAHSAAMFSSFNGGVGNRCAEESSV